MAEFPEWYDGKHVNEVKFCEEFLREHPMKSVNGTFFTVEGRVTDEDKLRREIYEMLKPYFSTALGKRVNNLLEALRLEAYSSDLPIQRDRIHVANGTLFLYGRFTQRARVLPQPSPGGVQCKSQAARNVAALPRRAALPGGHSDAARVHGLLLSAYD